MQQSLIYNSLDPELQEATITSVNVAMFCFQLYFVDVTGAYQQHCFENAKEVFILNPEQKLI